ncbi:MAG: TonB-dependent receptor [Arcobacteraceae bacterium]|nr:TonB-dependent receptor [Arcobacteraceae bacterium]
MRISKNKTLLCFLLATTVSYASATENLGLITVESSTIDDKFMEKKTEVSSVANVSGEKIDESHVENIQQILQQIPGITSEVKSGDSLKIHIRGVENQMYMGEKPGVAVVIDGVPVFERTGAVNIDLDNIESIKVIKGGASYLFGDDALSGAVIITTKRGAKYAHNFATIERGSFGYQKLLARTGYANDKLSFHVQGSERKADGYYEDSSYSAKYFNGKIQYYIDDSSDISFGTEYSQRKKDSHGTVGGETAAKNNPQSIFDGDMDSRDYTRMYDVDLLKAFATYSKDFENNSNLLVNGYVYTDDTSFWSSPQTRGATGLPGTYTDEDYTTSNFYKQTQTGIKTEYRTSNESFATLLGLDLRDNEYKNKTVNKTTYKTSTSPFAPTYYEGDIRSQDKTDENVYAIYGEYKHQLNDKLSATLNLRYDTLKLDYTNLLTNLNLKKDFNLYSYRVGSNYDLNDNQSLFINYSTGFRAPTINQMFAGDVSAWGNTESNPNLKEEQSRNYEIGTRGYVNTLFYEASIFRLDRKNFIMKTSGNYGGSTSTFTDMWDNIGGARHEGFELALSDNITKDLSYNISYTFLKAKYTDYKNLAIDLDGDVNTTNLSFFDVTGNYIPRTPKHTLNILLDYKITPKLTITSEINSKSNYYADDLNVIKIDNVTTLNLLTTYKTKLNGYDLTLFARVDNLFDKFYYNTARSSGDRNDDGIFNAEDLSITVNEGRKYTAGLALKF